jgi:hypothetical protein
MVRPRAVAFTSLVLVVFVGQTAAAQELSRYRGYALASSVAAVVAATGARVTDVATTHQRPALIQSLEWRPPYIPASERQDPLATVVFSFDDDRLYQMVVTYESERMSGLTDADVVEALTTTYGPPVLVPRGSRGQASSDSYTTNVILARWSDATTRVTLSRDADSPRFQLVFVDKAIDAHARSAITEAARLDLKEAPQRARDQQAKDALEVEQARLLNKAAFKP